MGDAAGSDGARRNIAAFAPLGPGARRTPNPHRTGPHRGGPRGIRLSGGAAHGAAPSEAPPPAGRSVERTASTRSASESKSRAKPGRRRRRKRRWDQGTPSRVNSHRMRVPAPSEVKVTEVMARCRSRAPARVSVSVSHAVEEVRRRCTRIVARPRVSRYEKRPGCCSISSRAYPPVPSAEFVEGGRSSARWTSSIRAGASLSVTTRTVIVHSCPGPACCAPPCGEQNASGHRADR